MTLRLLTGDDPILISEAVTELTAELVGDADRSLVVEELGESDYRTDAGEWSLGCLVDASRTSPFLTERRVVVGRHLARFSKKADYEPLVALVGDDLPTTDLVLVWERGVDPKMEGRFPTLPKAVKEAVEVAGGAIVDVTPPSRGKAAGEWVRDQLEASSLQFEPEAVRAVTELLGEDRSRIVGLLRTLEGALGGGATVRAADVETFGGPSGSVVPWELDDAIDQGDIAGALAVLQRLLPSRHPFQLVAALHGRYQRMLRLDGSGVSDEKEAAAVLGMTGSTFPAKKMLGQTRRLGSGKVGRAIQLLGEADLPLRGTVDWPDELVLEILVARLAALSSR